MTHGNSMLLPDVNVLVYAHRSESPDHAANRAWLGTALNGSEPVGLSELVLSAFVRIVTNSRVFLGPTPPPAAIATCETLLGAPAAVAVRPGPRHWGIFAELVRDSGARANTVPDAYLAALAIEHGATWVTHDRGFGRFAGLRWRRPLDPS